jgi:hypothetical protein
MRRKKKSLMQRDNKNKNKMLLTLLNKQKNKNNFNKEFNNVLDNLLKL